MAADNDLVFTVKDSDRPNEELGKHRMVACTYEPYWQSIRSKCGFKSLDLCRHSLAILEAYIMQTPRGKLHEKALRTWRVHNLLVAIPLGQKSASSISLIARAETSVILRYRRQIKQRLHTEGYPSEWDWAVARRGCSEFWHTDSGAVFLDRLYIALQQRIKGPRGKPELRYFLNMIQETSNYDD